VGSTDAQGAIDIVNYDVRDVIAAAERSASRTANPERAFTDALGEGVLGKSGLRNRYLEQGSAGRGTADALAPLTSFEQTTILKTGRFSGDRDHGVLDGDPEFKTR